MKRFLVDEDGVVSVEMVLWMAFLVPAATLIGQEVVVPLIENAKMQADLNEASLHLIEQALAVCPVTQ